MTTTLTHGTQSTYRKGCRCDVCRQNNTERQRRWRNAEPPPGGRVDVGTVDRIGTAWCADAACTGKPTEWWFAASTKTPDGQQAVAICKTCPVRATCLAWALQFQPHDLHGIWAATTQRERVRLRAKLSVR